MTVSAMSDPHHDRAPSSSSPSSHLSVGGGGGVFTFKFEQNENGSFVVSVFQESHRSIHQQDDVGALYYVVAVILIYGCSILMMIASYIRKNKVDRRLNRYLKEMANVRKRERRMTLMSTAAAAAKTKRSAAAAAEAGGPEDGVVGEGGTSGTGEMGDPSRSQSPSPSFNLTPSGRESPANFPTGESSPVTDTGALHAPPGCSHSPFLGVDRVVGWPGLQPSPHPHQRPSSPVLIVCDHSDYDSDSEPNNSDRSDYRPRHPIKTGRKSVKLCIPMDVVPTEQGRKASPGRRRRGADCSDHGTSAVRDYGAHQQDSINSSDCRSDEEGCQKLPLWSSTQVVSNV